MKRMQLDLDREGQRHLLECARAMLEEPDQMHPPSKPAVIRWALRRAAERNKSAAQAPATTD